MAIRILAVGKKHEDWVEPGIERYQKRLKRPFDAEWVCLPHSRLDGQAVRQDESERLLKRLSPSDYIILLDERGQNLDSPNLATRLEAAFVSGKSVVYVIGGAYGVDDRLFERADLVWSLSKLVFPHQLVRLILTEQLYRAQEISRGGAYHHK